MRHKIAIHTTTFGRRKRQNASERRNAADCGASARSHRRFAIPLDPCEHLLEVVNVALVAFVERVIALGGPIPLVTPSA
jgi:hypothetical protein